MDQASHEAKLGTIRVGLREDLVVTRQVGHTGARYVVHDPLTFRNHMFTELEYRVLTGIVAQRTLTQGFTRLREQGVLEDDDREEFYEFVLRLHGMNLLLLPVTQPEATFDRYCRKRAARRAMWQRSLLYFKVPLINPDAFLERTVRWVGWLFSRTGVLLWSLLMLAVLWKCGGRIGEMWSQTGNLLQIGNLPILWVALVLLKVIHEFGHAYACRRHGGEVPEMGVVFLVMTPCAYVDANASWKFTSRWQRIGVGMGGMYVESIVAGIFALIWSGTQPGLVHDVALNVVVLAGAVTVLLNLNPLLKFDGYFVFSDLLGVVNLQERAYRYLKDRLGWLFLGLPRPAPVHDRRERWLYAVYGPCGFAYRMLLAFSITTLVMMQWPSAGLVLGLGFAWLLIVQPVLRLMAYLWRSEDLETVRDRARLVAVGMLALAGLAAAFLPVSRNVVAPGTLDPASRQSVRAPVSGFVAGVAVQSGESVSDGDLLCMLDNPELETRRLEFVGEMEAERVRLDVTELVDPVAAAAHRARLEYLRARVAEMKMRQESLMVVSGTEGVAVLAEQMPRPGRYYRQGQELMQVHSHHRFLRVVLTEHDVLRARVQIGSPAEIRWAAAPARAVPATVREVRRSASRTGVPTELTMLGGGDVYARPLGETRAEADQPYLHVFLEPEWVPLAEGGAGLTARVRLAARAETLGAWVKRQVLTFLNTWQMT